MADKSWTDINLKSSYALSNFKFMVDDTDIDLVNGTILTHPNEHTIAEYIALAFSISLLHVLCQPHPMDWEPGQIKEKAAMRGQRKIQTLDVGKVAMFTAVGMSIATPSNHHIRKKYGKRYYPCYMGIATVMYLDSDSGFDWGCDYDGTGNGCGYGFSETTDSGGNGGNAIGGIDFDGGGDGGNDIGGIDFDGGGDGDGAGCGGCGGCGGGGDLGGGDFGGGGSGWGGASGGDTGGDSGGDGGGGGGDGGGGGGDGGGGGGCGGGGCGGGGCGGGGCGGGGCGG